MSDELREEVIDVRQLSRDLDLTAYVLAVVVDLLLTDSEVELRVTCDGRFREWWETVRGRVCR